MRLHSYALAIPVSCLNNRDKGGGAGRGRAAQERAIDAGGGGAGHHLSGMTPDKNADRALETCTQLLSFQPSGQSCKPHPSQREEVSGHTATIELSPQQKLDVTNQIRALRRLHPLSWSTIMSQRV